MNYFLRLILVIISFINFYQTIYSVTFVYNIRISETTQRIKATKKERDQGSLIVIDETRTKYHGPPAHIRGGLGLFCYMTDKSYLRISSAAARITRNIENLYFSRVQMDDVLISAGRSTRINKRIKLGFTGHLGIPTHRNLGFEGIQFGTGHYGLGGQLDSSLSYISKKNLIFTAFRYIRFFKRKVDFQVNNNDLIFNFGNLIDLLVATQNSWGKHHMINIGYNATLLFRAFTEPYALKINQQTNFIRSTFFGAYTYKILFSNCNTSLTFGSSYGFDQKSLEDPFGNKKIISLWGIFSVAF